MPIFEKEGLFRLDTAASSYWLRLTPFGHLEHLHYGALLPEGDPSAIALKRSLPYGSAVLIPSLTPPTVWIPSALSGPGWGRGIIVIRPAR